VSDKSVKVATPFLALTVVVPWRVAPPGLSLMAMDTLELSVVTLPKASSTATVTGGLMVEKGVVFVGCCRKASWLAIAALTVKLAVIAGVSLPSVNIKV
jgi:hypothetical protein